MHCTLYANVFLRLLVAEVLLLCCWFLLGLGEYSFIPGNSGSVSGSRQVSCIGIGVVVNFSISINMSTLKQLIELGKEIGYKDEELKEFDKSEQDRKRNKREQQRKDRVAREG